VGYSLLSRVDLHNYYNSIEERKNVIKWSQEMQNPSQEHLFQSFSPRKMPDEDSVSRKRGLSSVSVTSTTTARDQSPTKKHQGAIR
jgi:hypothetical protein